MTIERSEKDRAKMELRAALGRIRKGQRRDMELENSGHMTGVIFTFKTDM